MTDHAEIARPDLRLPRVSARDAAALTRAARVLGELPRTVDVALGELGSIVLAREGVVALAPASPAGSDVVLALSRGDGEGRLVIDGGLARRIVARALGGEVRPGAPLAQLGLGERGVVAGVVAGVLQALGAGFSVSLAAPDASGSLLEGGVGVPLEVSFAGARGWARLELPTRWLGAPTVRADELAALEIEARVEIARTHLPAGTLAGVEPGDAVVFDGEPPYAEPHAPVRLVVGAYAAPARLGVDGLVTLEDVLRPAAAARVVREGPRGSETSEEVDMERRDTQGRGIQDGVTAVLAEAPIEVVAELGRLVLRGEEIAGLGPGAVLALGRPGSAPVALRVGGEIWAEGELVDVDGELGVRVTASRRSGFPARLL
jgi:type III secretion system YscQ/HrcQ family protein